MLLARVAIADIAQTDGTGHVLQFAIAVRGACQAIKRMIGDVKLHHASSKTLEPVRLRPHHHSGRDGRGAGGGRPGTAIDLDEAKPA